MATTRLTPSCMATGQAAGTAAAIASMNDMIPQEIDIQHLQHELIKGNMILK